MMKDHRKHYVHEMALTYAVMHRDMNTLAVEAMWQSIREWKWSPGEFTNAMQQCRNEMTRMPTLSEIKARFIADPKSVDDRPVRIEGYTEAEDDEIRKLIHKLPKTKIRTVAESYLLGNPARKTYAPVAKCSYCDDRGWVEVWHPHYLNRMLRCEEQTDTRHCVIRCQCQEGLKNVEPENSKIPDHEYDPAKHCKSDQDPKEFYAARLEGRGDFDDWNNRIP